jgi:hypothetical protein
MVAEYSKTSGWKSISEGLPSVPVYCIEADSSNGTLYAGTYDGIYYRPKNTSQWELYNDNSNNTLPHVGVYDIAINYTKGQIIAATWGRGMWVSPKYTNTAAVLMKTRGKKK